MDVYRVRPGQEIIHEGEQGDFMLLMIEGGVEVFKQDRWNTPKLIATIDSRKTLGEMSMIAGEPRFATCFAAEPCVIRGAVARKPGAHHSGATRTGGENPDGAGKPDGQERGLKPAASVHTDKS
jgi:hypothetical protein